MNCNKISKIICLEFENIPFPFLFNLIYSSIYVALLIYSSWSISMRIGTSKWSSNILFCNVFLEKYLMYRTKFCSSLCFIAISLKFSELLQKIWWNVKENMKIKLQYYVVNPDSLIGCLIHLLLYIFFKKRNNLLCLAIF